MSEDTPTVKLRKAVQHESTSLITRGVIGLGVAYICWASGQLVDNFEENTKTNTAVLRALVVQVERLTVATEEGRKNIEEIAATQRTIRDKVIRLEVVTDENGN